jgi:hypothetical protein
MEPPNPITHFPAELINLITAHARKQFLRLRPYPTLHRKARCRCLPTKKRGYYDDLDGGYGASVLDRAWQERDGVLALSMTCKRLRRVIFEEKLNRSVPVGLCEKDVDVAWNISHIVRKDVK